MKQFSVFTLGGSTTFGYNVADQDTWPSYLSEYLNQKTNTQSMEVIVSNYGRGFYETSQEMVLLIDLFKNGHRPDLVIFMDGLNWGPREDIPHFTVDIEESFYSIQHVNNKYRKSYLLDFLKTWLHVFRLAERIKTVTAHAEMSLDRGHPENNEQKMKD